MLDWGCDCGGFGDYKENCLECTECGGWWHFGCLSQINSEWDESYIRSKIDSINTKWDCPNCVNE